MKTTVEIPDGLMLEIKRYALDRKLTFRQVVETSLRETLQKPRPVVPFKLKDCSFKGDGMVKDFTWDEIRDIIYEPRGLDLKGNGS
jgi:hypothetical protein